MHPPRPDPFAVTAAALAALAVAAAFAPAVQGQAVDGGADAGEVLLRMAARDGWTDGRHLLAVDLNGTALRSVDLFAGTSAAVEAPGPVGTGAAAAQLDSPRVQGDRLAVLRDEDGLPRLYLRDGGGAWAAVRPVAGQLQPTLASDGLAFIQGGDRLDLWLSDGNGTRAITADAASQTEPRLDGTSLAWVDSRNISPGPLGLPAGLPVGPPLVPPRPVPPDRMDHPQNLDVYVYDRRLGTTLQATNEPLAQTQPALVGGRLAYVSSDSASVQTVAHRDRTSPLLSQRTVVDGVTPTLLASDGRRAIVLQGDDAAPVLFALGLEDGTRRSMPAPTQGVALSAGHGVAALRRIDDAGHPELVVLRLPSPLGATVRASGGAGGDGGASGTGCFDVQATAFVAPVALWLVRPGAAPARIQADGGEGDGRGRFRVCAPSDASLRLTDDAGASALLPLAATPTSASSSSSAKAPVPAWGVAVSALVAAAARRRARPAA